MKMLPKKGMAVAGYVKPRKGVTNLIKRSTYDTSWGALVNYPRSFFTNKWKDAWSHVELVFSEEFTDQHIRGSVVARVLNTPNTRLSFSASEQDGCSRLKMIDYHDGHWEFCPIEKILPNPDTDANDEYCPYLLTPEDEGLVYLFVTLLLGMSYDTVGLGQFTIKHLKWIHTDAEKLFCSKAVSIVLHALQDIINPNRDLIVADVEDLMDWDYIPSEYSMYEWVSDEPPSPQELKEDIVIWHKEEGTG